MHDEFLWIHAREGDLEDWLLAFVENGFQIDGPESFASFIVATMTYRNDKIVDLIATNQCYLEKLSADKYGFYRLALKSIVYGFLKHAGLFLEKITTKESYLFYALVREALKARQVQLLEQIILFHGPQSEEVYLDMDLDKQELFDFLASQNKAALFIDYSPQSWQSEIVYREGAASGEHV